MEHKSRECRRAPQAGYLGWPVRPHDIDHQLLLSLPAISLAGAENERAHPPEASISTSPEVRWCLGSHAQSVAPGTQAAPARYPRAREQGLRCAPLPLVAGSARAPVPPARPSLSLAELRSSAILASSTSVVCAAAADASASRLEPPPQRQGLAADDNADAELTPMPMPMLTHRCRCRCRR